MRATLMRVSQSEDAMISDLDSRSERIKVIIIIIEKGKRAPPTIQSVKVIDKFLVQSKGIFSLVIKEEGANFIPVLIDSLAVREVSLSISPLQSVQQLTSPVTVGRE